MKGLFSGTGVSPVTRRRYASSTRLRRAAMLLATCVLVAIFASPAVAQRHVLGGGGAGLHHWGPVRPIQPIVPIQPIHPIRPVNPIYPWNPWWRNGLVVNPNYLYPYSNYYYPPARWDAGRWDGQTRNTQPQLQPKTPRPPEKPLVMEWNAAKGKAEVVNLGRWDNKTQTEQSTESPPVSQPALKSEGTEKLNRWDDSLP